LPARSRTRDAGGAFHGDPDGAEKFMARLLAGPRARENVQAGDPDDAIRSYQANLAWRRGDKTRALAEATALWRQGPRWSRPAALYFLIVFAHDEGRDADLIALVNTLARTPSNLWRLGDTIRNSACQLAPESRRLGWHGELRMVSPNP